MSQFVREWRVGNAALWKGPFGGFPYSQNKVRTMYVMYNCHDLPHNSSLEGAMKLKFASFCSS